MKSNESFVNLAHTRGGKQERVMKQIHKDGICPFCAENLKKYHEGEIIEESNHWFVTTNDHPYKGMLVHLMFVYKRDHIECLSRLPPQAMADLQKLSRKYIQEMKIDGGTLLLRFGDTNYNGASVSHLHAHIISGAHRKDKESTKFKRCIAYSLPE